MLRTYSGACHCGRVRFEADIDVAAGTSKCNCSYCARMRMWSAQVRTDAFRLIAGEDDLADYRGNNPVAHHTFCRHCGIHPFEWVDTPNMSGIRYCNINVACLDGVDIGELLAAPLSYRDGRNNDWASTPTETRHL